MIVADDMLTQVPNPRADALERHLVVPQSTQYVKLGQVVERQQPTQRISDTNHGKVSSRALVAERPSVGLGSREPQEVRYLCERIRG
jgi:hypothetical protein